MVFIESIKGFEILDSRGNPTIECCCRLNNGIIAVASVPSGASTGAMEAYELRDKDHSRYGGRGVLNAVDIINNQIAPKLIGMDPTKQEEIDDIMLSLDGTFNLSRLGANSILSISLAVAKAAAKNSGLSFYQYVGDSSSYLMPVPFMNILNGGEHASNNLDIQELMIVPVGFNSFSDALRAGAEIYHMLATILIDKGLSTGVGDEGGFAPNVSGVSEAFDLILLAITKAGYKAGSDVCLAIDVAASEFYNSGKYKISADNKVYTSSQWCEQLTAMVEKYPIISIEDGMAEDDIEGWKLLTKALGEKIQLVGDDLFVTQAKILRKGIENGLANAILIKPNQVGTLTGALLTIGLARKNNYNIMISHRSGETCDHLIADLAVASGSGQIKTGAPRGGERLAKYNRLLKIEQELSPSYSDSVAKKLSNYIKKSVVNNA